MIKNKKKVLIGSIAVLSIAPLSMLSISCSEDNVKVYDSITGNNISSQRAIVQNAKYNFEKPFVLDASSARTTSYYLNSFTKYSDVNEDYKTIGMVDSAQGATISTITTAMGISNYYKLDGFKNVKIREVEVLGIEGLTSPEKNRVTYMFTLENSDSSLSVRTKLLEVDYFVNDEDLTNFKNMFTSSITKIEDAMYTSTKTSAVLNNIREGSVNTFAELATLLGVGDFASITIPATRIEYEIESEDDDLQGSLYEVEIDIYNRFSKIELEFTLKSSDFVMNDASAVVIVEELMDNLVSETHTANDQGFIGFPQFSKGQYVTLADIGVAEQLQPLLMDIVNEYGVTISLMIEEASLSNASKIKVEGFITKGTSREDIDFEVFANSDVSILNALEDYMELEEYNSPQNLSSIVSQETLDSYANRSILIGEIFSHSKNELEDLPNPLPIGLVKGLKFVGRRDDKLYVRMSFTLNSQTVYSDSIKIV